MTIDQGSATPNRQGKQIPNTALAPLDCVLGTVTKPAIAAEGRCSGSDTRPSRATAHHLVEIAPTAISAPLPGERVRSIAPLARCRGSGECLLTEPRAGACRRRWQLVFHAPNWTFVRGIFRF